MRQLLDHAAEHVYGLPAFSINNMEQLHAVPGAASEVDSPAIVAQRLPGFPSRFAAAGRPGAYLRIVIEGDVAAGGDIRVLSRPDHGVTVGLVERAYHADRSLVPRLLDAPELADGWREWADHVLGYQIVSDLLPPAQD